MSDKKRPHQWVSTGITIDIAEEGFIEKYCAVCGAINWGGNEDGYCQDDNDTIETSEGNDDGNLAGE